MLMVARGFVRVLIVDDGYIQIQSKWDPAVVGLEG